MGLNRLSQLDPNKMDPDLRETIVLTNALWNMNISAYLKCPEWDPHKRRDVLPTLEDAHVEVANALSANG